MGSFCKVADFTLYLLMKVRLLVKTLLMEIILRLKVALNQVKTKKLCFRYFCRFVTHALTLRPQNTLCFSSIVWFMQFLSHFLWVLEARSKVTPFYNKF